MSKSRERILGRLRAAQPANCKPVAAWDDLALFSDYPASGEQRLELFAAKLLSLRAEFFPTPDAQAAAHRIKTLLQSTHATGSGGAANAARHANASLDEIFQKDAWLARHCVLLQGETSNGDFEKFEVGITAADFLVARTGSIVLQAANAGGRRLSVLPPFHIIVAKSEQLVDSLDEALAHLSQQDQNATSYITIITGPSRTSDIEKTLVLGAHGPKRLAVILIGTGEQNGRQQKLPGA